MMNKSQALYAHAEQVIPGGVQLLSKRPEMFAPDQWPNYEVKASCCEVWDLYSEAIGGHVCQTGFARLLK